MIKSKVLIVDDEVDYCMIMKEYFQSINYEASLAFTLKEGLKMLEEFQPDILLLDNNLPDGKGWEFLNSISEKFPAIKVFLISAYSSKSDVSARSPNVTVWEKPVSLSLLNSTFKV